MKTISVLCCHKHKGIANALIQVGTYLDSL